ncbi:MAG: hypothetical protein JJV93_01475 [Alphaproteobacteria bacterium]|nr:hypothetical protein [Alphaproteobacteria bacterium]
MDIKYFINNTEYKENQLSSKIDNQLNLFSVLNLRDKILKTVNFLSGSEKKQVSIRINISIDKDKNEFDLSATVSGPKEIFKKMEE